MFTIKTEKIKVGGAIAGEDIVVRTVQQTNNTSTKISIKYNAWSSSEYNKTEIVEEIESIVGVAAPRIPLTDVPSEITFDFDSQNQIPDWELGNQLLIDWLKTNLGLTDDDFIISE